MVDGVSVVVRGRESRPHGEGRQAVGRPRRPGTRDAKRRNGLGNHRERGRRRLPLEDIYRLLFNRDLYLRAYGRHLPQRRCDDSGATSETVDAMTLEKIDGIIGALRTERFRWTPVRRTFIPKKSGKSSPLGIPTWSDKLLQEVVCSLLKTPTTSLSSVRTPTGSVPIEVATPPSERSPSTGEGSSGSSRETYLNASTALTTRCRSRS